SRASPRGRRNPKEAPAVPYRRQHARELTSMLLIGGLALALGGMLLAFGDGPPEVYAARAAAITGILAVVAFTLAWIVRGHRLPPDEEKNGGPPPPPPAGEAPQDPTDRKPWGTAG